MEESFLLSTSHNINNLTSSLPHPTMQVLTDHIFDQQYLSKSFQNPCYHRWKESIKFCIKGSGFSSRRPARIERNLRESLCSGNERVQ